MDILLSHFELLRQGENMSNSGERSCMLLGEITSAGTADESSSEYHISISAASETAGSSSSPFTANAPAANVKRKRTESKPLHFTPELKEDIAEWWRANTILYDKGHHRLPSTAPIQLGYSHFWKKSG